MRYDPFPLLLECFEHLRDHAVPHVKMALIFFFTVQAMVFGSLCLGMFTGIGAAVATRGSEAAGPLMVFGMYGVMILAVMVISPMYSVLFHAYQKAVLDEVDGLEPAGPAAVWASLKSLLWWIFPMVLIQCGAGIVGILLCYVGVFFTTAPLRFAWLIKADRGVSITDALALAWEGFWARPGAHLAEMGVLMLVGMVAGSIPLVGMLIALPMIAMFEVKSYRFLYGPRGGASADVAPAVS